MKKQITKTIASLALGSLLVLSPVCTKNSENNTTPGYAQPTSLEQNLKSENKESIWDVISDSKDYMLELVSENEHYIPFTTGGYPRCVGIALPFLIAGGVAMYFAWLYEKGSKRNNLKNENEGGLKNVKRTNKKIV